MLISRLAQIALVLFPLAALAQTAGYQPNPGKSGIDLGAMDTAVSPCTNFYEYSCGLWRAKNPMPPDRARWGRFDELAEHSLEVERDILEKSAQVTPARSALDQKIGDFYAACMNEAAIETNGVTPIKPLLGEIDALRSKEQLAALLASLGKLGISGMFSFGSAPDFKDASRNIAAVDQGGLSLPDRDYYLKTDATSVAIREKYQRHLANMFALLAKALNTGWDSNAKAAAVLKFETALAQASMDRAGRRDPNTRNHPTAVKDLNALTPGFQWSVFFADEAAPSFQRLNVGNPEFFKQLGVVLNQTSVDDLKTYLTWRVLLDTAVSLPKPFVDENFDFFGKTLTGAKEIQPRWKRCVERNGRRAGRSARSEIYRSRFQWARQSESPCSRQRDRTGYGTGHQDRFLDDRRHQEAGACQTRGRHQQDWLSG